MCCFCRRSKKDKEEEHRERIPIITDQLKVKVSDDVESVIEGHTNTIDYDFAINSVDNLGTSWPLPTLQDLLCKHQVDDLLQR